MKTLNSIRLSEEEQSLLLDVLFKQSYAKEVVSCELYDIEKGHKQVDEKQVKKLTSLFMRLDQAGL